MDNAVTYRAVKEDDKPEYWIAILNGKTIATSMSEQGVRAMVNSVLYKDKQKKRKQGA